MAMKKSDRAAARKAAAARPERGRPGFFWSRLHFLLRFLGLTGFLVACVGLVLAGLGGLLASWEAARDAVRAAFGGSAALGTWLVLGGTAAALLALLVEALVFARIAAGRRSAFGFNALFQVALAAVLFVGLNFWSFDHFLKFDWTRSGQFTLPEPIRRNLERLDPNSKTLVVVYQQHKLFGNLRDKPPDDYDNAAERVVEEKVKDLVDQFRDFGPQFQVETLDVTRHGEDDKRQRLIQESAWYKLTDAALRALRAEGMPESVLAVLGPLTRKDFAPREKFLAELAAVLDRDDLARWQENLLNQARDRALAEAIKAAPENTIFVYAAGRLQQLRFNEFLQLDRVASQQANGGRGNLVLLAQGVPREGIPFSGRGVEPFARKVLNVEERKPRVGVLVVHELLTTEGSEDAFTLRGLRKLLEDHGFEVRDVVLKRGWESGSLPEPAADTFEESKLERLDADLDDLEADVKTLETGVQKWQALADEWSLKPGDKEEDKLDQLSRKYARELGGRKVTALGRQRQQAQFQSFVNQIREELAATTRERDALRSERARLDVDALQEARRMSDVKAKLDRALADCDLMLLPRLTRRVNGSLVPNRVHRLSEPQVAGIKEFLQAGKPILACLGPVNEPSDLPPDLAGPDGLEALLGELGVRLGKQTVLFNADARSFADRRVSPLRVEEGVKVPPLDFETSTAVSRGVWGRANESAETSPLLPNPIREALRVTAHSVGADFDLRMRFPRPVYFEPAKGRESKVDPVFLLTAEGWNDDQPFVTRGRKPHYEPPRTDDPANGTLDERRRGHFPVGIAVETPLPESWSSVPPRTVRLAVIGQGDVFVGNELGPTKEERPFKERLFLQTANWLLGRDDALPQGGHPWSYPRVDLAPGSRDEQLWLWGTRLGLPVLFAYLGLVVLLVRRLR
jgi:hypothetical protein